MSNSLTSQQNNGESHKITSDILFQVGKNLGITLRNIASELFDIHVS